MISAVQELHKAIQQQQQTTSNLESRLNALEVGSG
jgi:hypothetical protein